MLYSAGSASDCIYGTAICPLFVPVGSESFAGEKEGGVVSERSPTLDGCADSFISKGLSA